MIRYSLILLVLMSAPALAEEQRKPMILPKDDGPTIDKLVVTFVGDYGATPDTTSVLQRIATISPQLHFATGDFSYSQLPEEEWCRYVRHHVPITPFLLVPGNHESDGKDGRIENFAACLPYSYSSPLNGIYPDEYAIDVPARKPLVRFIAISADLDFPRTHVDYINNNKHAAWLDSKIKEGRKAGAKWIVVLMHKVCLNTEKKNCEIGEDLVRQLIKNRVDVVMAGHVHAYERTYPLSCLSRERFDPTCIPSNKEGPYGQGTGTSFVTVGTGGVNIRHLNPKSPDAPYFAKNLGLNEGAPYGVAKLTITKDELIEEFVESRDGDVLDSFVIKR